MGQDHSKKKVLVVDDCSSVMQSLVLILRAAGFDAAGALTAEAALQAATQHCPDVLLCDIQLGCTNGIELSLEVWILLPSCRIILISGDTSSAELLNNALERGNHFEVIAKPAPPKELLALLRKP